MKTIRDNINEGDFILALFYNIGKVASLMIVNITFFQPPLHQPN